jgi:hypothetical protein
VEKRGWKRKRRNFSSSKKELGEAKVKRRQENNFEAE